MDLREKLVELIRNGMACPGHLDPFGDHCEACHYYDSKECDFEFLADHLIANGVTVQEWIPVTEPPKVKGCYFVTVLHWLDGNPVTREAYWNGADWLSCDRRHELTPRVTHWMPLPEPLKGD